VDRQQLTSLFDLTDRVVVVTGGTRGLGLSLAEGYAAAGAKVVVASRKAEACEAAEVHLRSLGAEALGVPTHLGDLDALAALVAAAVERFGGIDVVVNNAANALTQPLGQLTPEAFAKSFDVNLRGPVFLIQEAMPHLIRSPHAAVLNILSVGAFMFSNPVAMYSAAKAAMLSFTRSYAAELAPHGVRVNAIAPGAMETDMLKLATDEFRQLMVDAALQHRVAGPDELVGPALLLTSDAGSYITGQVLVVDGGSLPY
jgi:NAD(P)-dependent dehydrogenase (short-subunit alcohol dehydrogenase family)